jgi:hypothetical protein
MLAGDGLRGVSEAACTTDDFIVAGSSHGGMPALIELAARGAEVQLTGIRNATAFGKRIPSPGADIAAGQPGSLVV